MANSRLTNSLNLDLSAALLAGDPDPGFLPCPKISLYVDPNLLGSCGICHVKLDFRSNSSNSSSNSSRRQEDDGALAARAPTTPTQSPLMMMSGAEVTMVPCGHLACYACITQCLRAKPECPFCRCSLRYELCAPRHAVRVCRVLTKESLFSLPDTIPMGGRMASQCPECRVSTNKLASEVILKSLAEDWERLRGQYQKGAGGESARVAMRHKVRILQQSFQLLTDRLSDHGVAAMGTQW